MKSCLEGVTGPSGPIGKSKIDSGARARGSQRSFCTLWSQELLVG